MNLEPASMPASAVLNRRGWMRKMSSLALSAAPLAAWAEEGAVRKSPSLAPIEDVPGLPRVLLIGDSISIGYTLPVRELLKGRANVHRPPTNCGSTHSGMGGLEKWVGTSRWDVIHFNWGMHDLKLMASGRQNVPLPLYEKNLRELGRPSAEERCPAGLRHHHAAAARYGGTVFPKSRSRASIQ